MKENQLFILILILFLGCETVVELDVPRDDPKLVVIALINPDSVFSAQVYKSAYILDSVDEEIVENASVKVYNESGGMVSDLEYSALQQKYISAEVPEPGINYELRVSAPGFKEVKAINSVPSKPVEVSQLQMKEPLIDGYPYENTSYDHEHRISLVLKDSPDKDYYEFVIQVTTKEFLNDSLYYQYTLQSYIVDDEDPLFEMYTRRFNMTLLGDELINGNNQKIIFDTEIFKSPCYPGNHFESCYNVYETNIIIRRLSEAYFKYYQSAGLQLETRGDPLAEPVNIYSNVENGFGVFAGYVDYYFWVASDTVRSMEFYEGR